MRKNDNFILNEIADKYVLIPVGNKALDFNGIVTMNQTAKFLWEHSNTEFTTEELVQCLADEYEISGDMASEAVAVYINKMKEVGCIE